MKRSFLFSFAKTDIWRVICGGPHVSWKTYFESNLRFFASLAVLRRYLFFHKDSVEIRSCLRRLKPSKCNRSDATKYCSKNSNGTSLLMSSVKFSSIFLVISIRSKIRCYNTPSDPGPGLGYEGPLISLSARSC